MPGALLLQTLSRPVPNVGCDSLVCFNVQLSLPTGGVADIYVKIKPEIRLQFLIS